MKSADNFETIVKQVIGEKQGFHTFSYDDMMAVVTAARACVEEGRNYAKAAEDAEAARDEAVRELQEGGLAVPSTAQPEPAQIFSVASTEPTPEPTGEDASDAQN